MLKDLFIQNKDSQDSQGSRKGLSSVVLLGLILLLGTALRFYDLGAESYWIDEMSTVIEAQQSIRQLITSGRLDQPPAYYLPFQLWVQILGTSEVSTRSFSALVGIGSIVLIYLIGRELFGKPVGLLSAFLMGISGFQIYYSQIARFYSFFEFTALLSYLFFILALRSKRIIHFALYGIASILMVYSHTYGIFILFAQNLFFFIQAKKNRNAIAIWLICQAMIGLALFSYLFPLLFGTGGVRGAINFNIGGRSTPTSLDPLKTVYRFILSTRRERSWDIILVNYAAAGALLVAGTWIYVIQQGKRKFLTAARGWVASLREVPDGTSKFFLVSCWLLFPIILPFIFSMVIAPMYTDHYTISAAPALYLLLALGIFSARKLVPIIISLGALLIMVVPGLHYYYVNDVNEQWKEAAVYVEENTGRDEVIVFAPNMGIGIQQRTFNWYYRGTLPGCGLVNQLIDPVAISEALDQCISGQTRIWVIVYDPAFPYKSYFQNPNQTAMQLIKEQQLVGVSVYLYELTN